MEPSQSCVHLHLIGKNGSGKSATGNSILKKQVFVKRWENEKVAFYAKTLCREGVIVYVWDWPGTTSDTATTKNIIKTLKENIRSHKLAIHILLWVFRYAELFGKEEEEFYEVIVNKLGKDTMSSVILIFTSMDNFKQDTASTGQTYEEWQREQIGFFQQLRTECNNRVIGFDNKSEDDEQIEKLRNMIHKLVDEQQCRFHELKGFLDSWLPTRWRFW